MPSTTLFIDPTRKGSVDPYYILFPTEPTPSDHSADWLTVGTPHVALDNQNLEGLLDAILHNVKRGGNVLFVGHGFSAGFGLNIGDPKNDQFADFPAFESIRRNQQGKQSDADTAKSLQLSADAYKKFKLQIESVQKLALNRVDARACYMGANDALMSDVQVIFGCDIFCAPKKLDAFGNVPFHVAKDKAEFEKSRTIFLKESSDAIEAGTSPDRLVLAFKDFNDDGVRAKGLAESKKAVTDWTGKHLPSPGAIFNGSQQLFIHGIMSVNDKSLFFAGDPEFRKLLFEAKKGHEPSRKIDINQPLQP
jgi:hypothetical protein